MTRALVFLAGVALASCGKGGPQDGNSVSTATVASAVAPRDCKAPTLAMAGEAQSLKSDQLKEAQANFETAYQKSCTDKLLAAKPLVDPKAADQEHIFLVNAPEANVASIYLSEVDGSRMVLEYPFLTTDGKSQVPSAAELEEAIYCAVVGATSEEQESTGRCLVD